MNYWLFSFWGLLFFPLLLLAILVLRDLYRVKFRRRRDRLALIYLRSLVAMCADRRRYGFPYIHTPGARMALAEAVAGLREVAADCDPVVLRCVVRAYDLEQLLLGRLRWPWLRAESLRLLSALPLSGETARKLAEIAPYSRRDHRFYLLLARLNASPREAIPLLKAFPDRLTSFECRLLLSLLIRGSLPLPSHALLEAPEENLRRLGLRVVRHFGLLQAIPRVRALVSDAYVGAEALQTLCDLGLPLNGTGEAIPEGERRALLRRAAQAGYALRGVEQLLRGEERIWFERLAASYKSAELWS